MLTSKNGFRGFVALGLLSIVVNAAQAGALAPQQKATADARMTPAKGQRLLATRSARFVENKGQWDAQARFLARSRNLELWFTDHGIRYDQYVGGKGSRSQAVDMSFVGGDKALVQGRNKLRTRIDYFLPGMSARDVGAYGELMASGVLHGVDMRSYFDAGRPRYDLVVAPGANARGIKLRFKGGNGLSVANGELRIATKLGGFANGKPLAFQLVNGKRVTVASRWKVLDAHTAGFELGSYDLRKPLVIDPLIFGTYFGGNTGADEVRAAVADSDKNVYFTGSTRDARFPVLNPGFPSTGDPSGLNINNGTGAGRSDAFVSRISGDAYSYDYSAFFGGTLDDFGQFIKFDPSGNIWVAGTTSSSDFPLNDRGNVQYLFTNGPNVPNGDAQFRLIYQGGTTAALPYNATTTQVANALTAVLGAGSVRSVTSSGGTLPFATYRIELAPNLPFAITVDSAFRPNGTSTPISQGLSLVYRVFGLTATGQTDPSFQVFRAFGSNGLSNGTTNTSLAAGTYTLTFTDQTAQAATQTTRAITARASGVAVAAELNRLTNLGTNVRANSTDTQFGAVANDPAPTLPGRYLYTIFFDSSATPAPNPNTPIPQRALQITSNLQPQCTYGTRSVTDIFVLHLNRNANGSLSPATDPVKIYGSDNSDELTGFDVWQNSIPTLGAGKVEFAISGTTTAPLKNIQTNAAYVPGGEVGFVLRQTWSAAESYREVPLLASVTDEPGRSLPYVRSPIGIPVDVHGVVFDSDGSFYTAGTIGASSNITTGVGSSAFSTTAGIYTGGNNIRNQDAFVRKYLSSGAIAISGILGGEGDDSAGGIGADLDGSRVNTGSAIAVDQFHNIYVTGVARSFNFPRTLNVFGPLRTNVTDIFVTKIDSSGANILYSTMLNTNPGGRYLGNTVVTGGNLFTAFSICEPAGIAVDSRGYAYITGNLRPSDIAFPTTVGDPNQPTSSTYPSISLAGPSDAVYDGPTGSEYPTIEPFVTVLNPTATALSLSTYEGGFLDDFVYGPSVTPYGDVFTVGWTDSGRNYTRVSSTGTPTTYITGGGFPLITNLAVKQGGDQSSGALGLTVGYGLWGTFGITTPAFVASNYSRDGFITQFRIDAASVSSLTFAPTSVPGGLGAFTTGTVTLSQAVGSGGGQIVISLPAGTSAASLQDPNVNPDSNSITIDVPQGATSATFNVYSKGVTSNTSVTVRATFEGTFKEAAFQVVPWLQRLRLSQDSIVGGDPNMLRGTVTLFAPAPVGGAQVTLSIDRVVPNGQPAPARIVNVPFTVPEGQTSAQFDIDTDGVAANVDVLVSASLLGVTKTATLTITPARLQSITLTPNVIASGGTATAVVTLNGKAPTGGYAVTLTSSNPSVTITPSTVVVPAQSVSSAGQTITISTTQNTSGAVTITAQHLAIQVSAILQVQQVEVAKFTLSPAVVESGGTSTGTIQLKANAPKGGAKVYLTGGDFSKVVLTGEDGKELKKENNVPYVVVPEDTDTVTFTVTAGYFGTQQSILFTIGGVSQTLTIKPLVFTFALTPNPVVGGNAVTGTITVPTAPTVPLTFHIGVANDTATPVDSNPTLPAGQTSVSVVFNTSKVPGPRTNDITVSFNGGAVTKTLTINPIGILKIVPVKKIVRGSTDVLVDVYFAGSRADLPANGVVTFTSSQPSIIPPRTFTVAQLKGSASATLFVGRAQLSSRRVSKSQDVTITATYAGSTATTVVTITR